MAEQNYTQQELKWIAEAEAQGVIWLGRSRSRYGNYLLTCGHECEIDNALIRRGTFKCKECLELKWIAEAEARGITWVGRSCPNRGYFRLPCGHEREIEYGNVRKCNFKCNVCFEQKIKDEAEAQGLTWLFRTRSDHGRYRLACGHEREICISDVRRENFRCNICFDQNLKDEVEALGVTWLGRTKAGYSYYRLACGHEREMANGDARKGEFKCQVCHEQKLKDEAEARGATWLGRAKNGYGNYRLACGHECEISYGSVRTGAFKCPVCFKQKFKDEAEAQGITWLCNVKHGYGSYRLNCGHEREIANWAVRQGCFKCHVCEESWATKPSKLYVLHIDVQGESLIKVGISSNVDRRIAEYGLPDEAKVTVLKTVRFDTGLDAHKAEQSLLRKFKKHRKLGVDHIMRANGHTECFCPTALNKILAAA